MELTAGEGGGQGRLLTDLRSLIEAARERVARTANSALVVLYWNIGKRIQRDILKCRRADYGRKIFPTLSEKLIEEFGAGYSIENLRHMVAFVRAFPDARIACTLCTQLGWSHFRALIFIADPVKRDFYAEMCRIERWSVRTLRKKIGGMLYERTALSQKPRELAERELAALRAEDKVTPDLVFQDPYVLGFLGLKDAYAEKDLESAILREMESFILELGTGFAFVARQKRMEVGQRDYFLDLLFFHRGLKRLVAIELKLDRFRPEHKGQMELYLRWLEKYERAPGEEPPIGLILCAGKDHDEIELLRLDESGIRVAQYLTELPPKDVLERRLSLAVKRSRKLQGSNLEP